MYVSVIEFTQRQDQNVGTWERKHDNMVFSHVLDTSYIHHLLSTEYSKVGEFAILNLAIE